MINKIQKHHNDQEIEVIRLQNEVCQWKNELKFINHEITSFIKIFNSKIFCDSDLTRTDIITFLERFQQLEGDCSRHRKQCRFLFTKLEGKHECEDAQCDHAFLNEHILLRQTINNFMNELRELKYDSFEKIIYRINNLNLGRM